MAGVEKKCECPKGDCEYHGGKMYDYKRNHLQINPECREQFKGLTAFAVIVNDYNSSDNELQVVCARKFSSYKTYISKVRATKQNGVYLYEGMVYKTLNDKALSEYYYVPLRLAISPEVNVYVKEHDAVYTNYLHSAKSIRAFKRNMRKLFGYDIPIKQDLKFKQELVSYKLSDKLIEQMKQKRGF